MKFTRYLQLPLAVILFVGLTAYEPVSDPSMEVEMANPFIWHDLVTPDLDSSKAFYSSVFGWTFKDVNTKGLRIASIYAGNTRIGGAIEVPKANSAVWIKVIPVDDLERRVALVEQNGGKVLLPPATVPGRGTQVIMEGAEGEEFSFVGNVEASFGRDTGMGDHHFVWSELWADTPESSKAFYEVVFGVETEVEEVDERPYWIFHSGAQKVAGMIGNPITNQGTQWVPYVMSSNPSEVVDNARAGGAFVVLEPSPEVRDGKFGIFQDPSGALVCVQKK